MSRPEVETTPMSYPGSAMNGMNPADPTGGGPDLPLRSLATPQTGRGLRDASSTMAVAPPMPRDTDSRMDIWRGLLTDFMWSLGQGMAARPKGRGAGIGEALLGPFTLQEMMVKRRQEEAKIALETEQAQRTQAAYQQVLAKMEQDRQELPLKLQQMLARTGLIESQTNLADARTDRLDNPPVTPPKPGVERMSGTWLSAADAKVLQDTQGQVYKDARGNIIHPETLPSHMGLIRISGGTPGDPRWEIGTQPTNTVTQDNVTSVVPRYSPETPRTQGVAVTPSSTSGFSTTQNIGANGEVVNVPLPTGSTTSRQTGGQVVDRQGQSTATPSTTAPAPSPTPAAPVQRQAQPSSVTTQPQPQPQARQPGTGVGLPPAELARQRQFATPIKAAASQIFGDPANPGFGGLAAYANIADDPAARRRVGIAARMIVNQMAQSAQKTEGSAGAGVTQSLIGIDLGSLTGLNELSAIIKNRFGLPMLVASSQVAAIEKTMAALRPEEKEMLNRMIAAYGTVVGLRSLTRGGAYRFSVESMERELPIPGLSDVNDSKTYYNKLASLAEEIVTSMNGAGISRQVMPEQDFYRDALSALTQLGKAKPSRSEPLTDFIIQNGRVVKRPGK